MFFKSKWFRLILTLLISGVSVLIGLVFLKNGIAYDYKIGELYSSQIVFILFAIDCFMVFLSCDFLYFFESLRGSKLHIWVTLLNAFVVLGLTILEIISSITINNMETITIIEMFVFMPFAITHVLMCIMKTIGMKRGEGFFLVISQIVGIVLGFGLSYVLVTFCSKWITLIYAGCLLLWAWYFFAGELGLSRESLEVGSSVSKNADKGVASSMRKVARRYNDHKLLNSAGVYLYMRPRVDVTEDEVNFYIDYYFTGVEKMQSQSDVYHAQDMMKYEIDKNAKKIMSAARDEFSRIQTSRAYDIHVYMGNQTK
ncbi:MAG: hypothetical protein J1F32_01385 [Erysipelotrichales bacterium]|nr:hypothetical protein [Erysipelotrichales bacterium]